MRWVLKPSKLFLPPVVVVVVLLPLALVVGMLSLLLALAENPPRWPGCLRRGCQADDLGVGFVCFRGGEGGGDDYVAVLFYVGYEGFDVGDGGRGGGRGGGGVSGQTGVGAGLRVDEGLGAGLEWHCCFSVCVCLFLYECATKTTS